MVAESRLAERWSALATEDEGTRSAEMRALLDEVLALDESERQSTIMEMVNAEYRLPDQQLKPFTVSRLRTWLAIAADDMDRAKALARGYDTAFDRLPAGHAMRRATLVQSVARNDLAADEVQALFALIPSIIRQVPRTTPPAQHQEARPTAAKKPFWKFW